MTKDKASINEVKEQVRDLIDSYSLSNQTERNIAEMMTTYSSTRNFESLYKNPRELAARVADNLVTENGINYAFYGKLYYCMRTGKEKGKLREVLSPMLDKGEFKSRLYDALDGLILLVEDQQDSDLQHIRHVQVVDPAMMMKALAEYNPTLWDDLTISPTPITDIAHELSMWPKGEHLYGTYNLE